VGFARWFARDGRLSIGESRKRSAPDILMAMDVFVNSSRNPVWSATAGIPFVAALEDQSNGRQRPGRRDETVARPQ
jgi:hypothetical protein